VKIISIIPARMNSSRFPGKPLKKILDIPMIGHCYKRSAMCKDIDDTYVATCDNEIFEYIESIGGKAIMTSSDHERATDRTAEAMLKIEKNSGEKIDIVVMVQGDEPMIMPEMITLSLQPFKKNENTKVVNLYSDINSIDEFNDPNEVKTVIDNDSNALYFSREPIPSRRKGHDIVPMYKQVCVIPFKRDYLLEFNQTKQTPLEIIESIDMLRTIENGDKVKMVYSKNVTYSVDTEQDLRNVEKLMKNDSLIREYI
jgi:3-deoxy-manno-octulosonate cytidylyltransferase (CMP-KDO synthetase)